MGCRFAVEWQTVCIRFERPLGHDQGPFPRRARDRFTTRTRPTRHGARFDQTKATHYGLSEQPLWGAGANTAQVGPQ